MSTISEPDGLCDKVTAHGFIDVLRRFQLDVTHVCAAAFEQVVCVSEVSSVFEPKIDIVFVGDHVADVLSVHAVAGS